MNMHYIFEDCNASYKNKNYVYNGFCRVKKWREKRKLCEWSGAEEPVMVLLLVTDRRAPSSGTGAKYTGNSCKLQGSVGHGGNQIYFLSAEVIVLAQWMGEKLQYAQLESGWWEALYLALCLQLHLRTAERWRDRLCQSLGDQMKSISNLPHEGTHSFPSSISVIEMGIGACFPPASCQWSA